MTTTIKTEERNATEDVSNVSPDTKVIESSQSVDKVFVKQESVDVTIGEEEDIPDDEENLFIELEHDNEKEEEEEALHPHEQPKDVAAAPRLLQEALKKGEIKADESEDEGTNGSNKKVSIKKENGEIKSENGIEKENIENHESSHQHQRVSGMPFSIM
jgi:hypothetical protein